MISSWRFNCRITALISLLCKLCLCTFAVREYQSDFHWTGLVDFLSRIFASRKMEVWSMSEKRECSSTSGISPRTDPVCDTVILRVSGRPRGLQRPLFLGRKTWHHESVVVMSQNKLRFEVSPFCAASLVPLLWRRRTFLAPGARRRTQNRKKHHLLP